MVRLSGLPRLGAVGVLVVAAFLAGWLLSPDGALTGMAANMNSEPAATGAATQATSHHSDAMTELCERHMEEMGPDIDGMMHEMMSGMMHGGMR